MMMEECKPEGEDSRSGVEIVNIDNRLKGFCCTYE